MYTGYQNPGQATKMQRFLFSEEEEEEEEDVLGKSASSCSYESEMPDRETKKTAIFWNFTTHETQLIIDLVFT